MKYIHYFLIFSFFGTLCSMDQSHTDFLDAVKLGQIDTIDMESITKDTLDEAIYVASSHQQYAMLEFLLHNGANAESIPAQLAFVQARLQKDIKICTLLENAPFLLADKALFYAVQYNQAELVAMLAKQIIADPKYNDSNFLKLADTYAQIQKNTKIVTILSKHSMPKIQIPEALVIKLLF